MPDPVNGTPASGDTGAPQSTPQTSTPVESPSTPSTPPAVTSPPTATPVPSFLDMLRSNGVPLDSNLSEQQAAVQLASLWQQAQQSQRFAKIGQDFLPHQSEFQRWLAEKQKAAQPTKKGWDAPEWDPAWRHQVRRDQNGNLIPIADAPADLPNKIAAWAQHTTGVFDGLAKDPIGYLMEKAGLEEKLAEIIDKRFGQNFSQHQIQQQAQQIEQEVSGWVYEKGANGQPIVDPFTGQPKFSQIGQLYYEGLRQAGAMGIGDAAGRHAFAKGQLALIALQQQQATPPAPAPTAAQVNDQQKADFLKNAAARAAGKPPVQNGSAPQQPASGSGPRELARMMAAAAKAQGITDLSAAAEF